MGSPYMEWVKTQPPAEFPLVTSGLQFCPLSLLDTHLAAIEINGPSFYGHPPLLDAVARHCGADPDCVVLTEGTSMANHLAMACLLRSGDEVLMERPCYELLPSLASYLGATIRPFPRRSEDRFRIRPEDIRKAITPATRLIVLSNLHNPSSAFVDEATLAEIGDIAKDAGAKVLVDEVYLESLRPDSVPARSAFHLGSQFVTTNSLTKCYGLNGLRCGWALAEPDLARRMWRLNDLFGVIPAHPAEQLGLAAFGAIDKLRRRTSEHMAVNWRAFEETLGSHPALELFHPPGGTVVFPRLRGGGVDAFGARLLRDYGTSVVPGRFFGSPEHFRIGLGGDAAKVRAGLRRIADAASGHTGE
ncbi:MAG: pyridoxal phosphate-dependent aminotransferase [Verrucomicrobia bacterium]|nr:pyridoxal phosphate-dependent aminotransferase [Verrucomicrobiota bacterium]MBI3868556.1 pyridoxal phosphate-dependent aminotransferase [Verrucomicrobiota bacterium]